MDYVVYCSVKNYSPTHSPNRPSNLHRRREAIQKWIPLAASPNLQTPTVVREGSAKLFEGYTALRIGSAVVDDEHDQRDDEHDQGDDERHRRKVRVLSPVRRSPSTQNCSISLGLAVGNGRQLVDPSWLSGSCVILGGMRRRICPPRAP